MPTGYAYSRVTAHTRPTTADPADNRADDLAETTTHGSDSGPYPG
jgi:hypothetical protein